MDIRRSRARSGGWHRVLDWERALGLAYLGLLTAGAAYLGVRVLCDLAGLAFELAR